MTRSFVPALCAALLAGGTACVNPADSSDELSVRISAPGPLFVGDTVRLSADVLDATGAPAANVGVQFATSDALVAAVDPSGLVRATGVGTATLTASALGYLDAAVGQVTVEVHALLEVDSVRPRNVRWGDLVTIYGAGLDPESQRVTVAIGGIEAPIARFVPADSAQPGRFGQLTVWVPVPAPGTAGVAVFARGGAAALPQALTVGRRDRYEPNEAAPAVLGALTEPFINPALAWEPLPRDPFTGERGVGLDWFAWSNSQVRDLTVILRSTYPPERYGVWIEDTAATDGLQSDGLFECNGVFSVDTYFYALERDSFIVAIRNAPVEAYWTYAFYEAPFTTASPYELRILPGYRSMLPPDAFEENDFCGVAPTLPTGSSTLTIDVPGDVDWFRLTVPAGGRTLNLDLVAADTTADLDISIWDASVAWVDESAFFGSTESYSAFLPAGSYYIAISDYTGIPTSYSLTTSLTPAPPAGAPARAAPPALRPATKGPRPTPLRAPAGMRP